MGIILHYLIRSIRENTFRTFIVIFSVCLSGALLFASLSMTGTLEKLTVERIRGDLGAADILVAAEKTASDRLVRPVRLGALESRVQFQTGVYRIGGTVRNPDDRNQRFNLLIDGIARQDLERMVPVRLQQGSMAEFEGYALILGSEDARKMKVRLGDTLTVRIRDTDTKFRVAGIGEPTGALRPSSRNTIRVFVPLGHLQKINGAEGRCTQVLIAAASKEDIPDLVQALKKVYPKQDVRPVIGQEELERAIGETTTSLYIMLSLVVVMGIFIIYTAFKVIAFEKLPVIGTLRSVGATKGMADGILFMESAAYGIVGGLAGLGLGLAVLQVFAALLAENPEGGPPLSVELVYGPEHLAVSLLFSITLALVGSAIPIISVSRLPVKNIILNQLETGAVKTRRLWPGVLLIAAVLTAGGLARGEAAIAVDVVALAGVCVGLIMLAPALSDLAVRLMGGPFRALFGNVGILAVRNVKGNKSVVNNISLLMLGISGMIMINTISSSVGTEILNAYSKADFQVMMGYDRIDRQYEQRVRATEGVAGVYGFYTEADVPLQGKDYTIRSVQGVEPQYFDYWQYPFEGDRSQALKALETDRAILVTTIMRSALGLRLGDTLPLKLPKGTRSYTIAGFIQTMENEGSVAFLPARYMKTDFSKRYKDTLFIRTSGEPDAVKRAIEKKFARDAVWVQTVRQMGNEDVESNGQMFVVLQSFSVLTMVIGIFGILNNVLVSIMSRRRQFAVMRSVGLSRHQMIRMVVVEALFCGLTGGLAGCGGGWLFCVVSGFILRDMSIDMALHHQLLYYVSALGAGAVVTVAASLKPALQSASASIIESVKFE